MFDAFPFDEWSEDISDFWTFGGANSTGTYIMTALGVTVMVLAFIGFVMLEQRKLRHQAATLRASGALDRPTGPGA
jgi:heme exporter protein D